MKIYETTIKNNLGSLEMSIAQKDGYCTVTQKINLEKGQIEKLKVRSEKIVTGFFDDSQWIEGLEEIARISFQMGKEYPDSFPRIFLSTIQIDCKATK